MKKKLTFQCRLIGSQAVNLLDFRTRNIGVGIYVVRRCVYINCNDNSLACGSSPNVEKEEVKRCTGISTSPLPALCVHTSKYTTKQLSD